MHAKRNESAIQRTIFATVTFVIRRSPPNSCARYSFCSGSPPEKNTLFKIMPKTQPKIPAETVRIAVSKKNSFAIKRRSAPKERNVPVSETRPRAEIDSVLTTSMKPVAKIRIMPVLRMTRR